MMFRRMVCIAMTAALLLASASGVLAQETERATAASETAEPSTPEFHDPELNKLWEALMRMRYDMSVRVDRHSVPEPMGGRFQFATEQEVVVNNFGDEVRVPLEDVSELWREENRKGRSLLIGSVIGVIAGVGITALILSTETDDGESPSTGSALLLGGVGGAVLGITLGGLVGGEDLRWVREYPDP